jgi:transglutaminase-like putative cysteine protease
MDNMRLRGSIEFENDTDRIQYLADMVEAGSESPRIREFTLRLLNQKKVDSYDSMGEITAIFNYVRDTISYRRHVLCRDSFTTAERTLDLKSGDCDNVVVLLNSMLISVGIPTGFRIVSSKIDVPFHHIYSIAGLPVGNPAKWIPLDSTNKQAVVGWEPPYAKKKDFRILCTD